MSARETKKDWTRASGAKNFSLYSHNRPGWKISRILEPGKRDLALDHTYTDKSHDPIRFRHGGVVAETWHVGDTKGSEAGTKTRVDVTFNPIRFEMTQTSDCVDSNELSVNRRVYFGPRTIQRFQTQFDRRPGG